MEPNAADNAAYLTRRQLRSGRTYQIPPTSPRARRATSAAPAAVAPIIPLAVEAAPVVETPALLVEAPPVVEARYAPMALVVSPAVVAPPAPPAPPALQQNQNQRAILPGRSQSLPPQESSTVDVNLGSHGGDRARSASPVMQYEICPSRQASGRRASLGRVELQPLSPAASQYWLTLAECILSVFMSQMRSKRSFSTHRGAFYWIVACFCLSICLLIFQDPTEINVVDLLLDHKPLGMYRTYLVSGNTLCYLVLCDQLANFFLAVVDVLHKISNAPPSVGLTSAIRQALWCACRKIMEPILFTFSGLLIAMLAYPRYNSEIELKAAISIWFALMLSLQTVFNVVECMLVARGIRIPLSALFLTILTACLMTVQSFHRISGHHWEAAKSYATTLQTHQHATVFVGDGSITQRKAHSLITGSSLLPKHFDEMSTTAPHPVQSLSKDGKVGIALKTCDRPAIWEGSLTPNPDEPPASSVSDTASSTSDMKSALDMIMAHSIKASQSNNELSHEANEPTLITASSSQPRLEPSEARRSFLSELGIMKPFLKRGLLSSSVSEETQCSSEQRSSYPGDAEHQQSPSATSNQANAKSVEAQAKMQVTEFDTFAISTSAAPPKSDKVVPEESQNPSKSKPTSLKSAPTSTIDLSESAILARLRAEFGRIWQPKHDADATIRTNMYTGRDGTITDLFNKVVRYTTLNVEDGDIHTIVKATVEPRYTLTIKQSDLENYYNPANWMLWTYNWLFQNNEPRYAHENEIYSIKRSEATATTSP